MKDFYKLLYSPAISDSLVNADADSIAQKQKTVDMHMFRYFKSIRNICKPEQLPKFDSSITREIGWMVGSHPRGNAQGHPK